MNPHQPAGTDQASSNLSERFAIFRDTAIGRLASPDDLDDLMIVVSARAWLAVCALGLLLAGAFGWAIFGRVEIRVPAHGQLVATPLAATAAGTTTVDAELFVPVAQAVDIEPGMLVRMALRGFSPTRHGFLLGHVRQVDTRPTSGDASVASTSPSDLADQAATDAFLRLAVTLDTVASDDVEGEAYRWTSGAKPLPRLTPPIQVEATIAVRSEQPIQHLFPWLDEVAR